MSGQAIRRHPELPAYRCFLSDLTGFAGFRRAGPTRTRSEAYRRRGRLSIFCYWKSSHDISCWNM